MVFFLFCSFVCVRGDGRIFLDRMHVPRRLATVGGFRDGLFHEVGVRISVRFCYIIG